MQISSNSIFRPSLAEVVNRSPLTVHPDLAVAEALTLMSQAQDSYCELLGVGTVATELDLIAK